jgi:hypothetical protein
MSTAALATVSNALRDVLADALGATPVVLADPTKATAGEVSLWLYQVTVDEFSRNRPAAQLETAAGRPARLRLPPLGLNLSYLITPVVDDQEMAQTMLGAVMLALHERPQFAVELAGAEVNEFVRVSFAADALDDRVKLWEALSRPYRLSVCYQLRTARLVSTQVSADATVGSARTDLEEKPAPRVVE